MRSAVLWLQDHPRRATWLGTAALVLMAFAVYGQTLGRGWVVAPDDDMVWLRMVRGAHLWDIPSWFTHQPAFFYRPLTRISFFLDWTVWGNNPLAFRISHLLLYIAAALALGWFVYEVTRSRTAAFFAAAFYEVFAGNWEVAYWISARADILAALFVLAALALLVRAERQQNLWLWAGGVLCAVAGYSAKEMGLAVIPLVIVWAVVSTAPLRRSGRHWLWTGITVAILIAVAAGYWALHVKATVMGTHHQTQLAHGQVFWRKAVMLGGEWWWRTPIIGYQGIVTGSWPPLVVLLIQPMPFIEFWGGLAMWVGALTLAARRQWRSTVMLMAIYPLALLPVSGEIAVMPYRRFYYLPEAGSQAVTGFVCWALLMWCRERWPRWGWLALAPCIGLLGLHVHDAFVAVAPLTSHLFGR